MDQFKETGMVFHPDVGCLKSMVFAGALLSDYGVLFNDESHHCLNYHVEWYALPGEYLLKFAFAGLPMDNRKNYLLV